MDEKKTAFFACTSERESGSMMLISSSSSVASASAVVQVNDLTAFRYERYYSGVVAVTNTASAQYIEDNDGAGWVTREIRRFIYDGWNLVGETRTTTTGVSTNWYVWGLDMSGSIQVAGGVGGLLFVNFWGNSRNYFGYDGNGNVSDLVAAGDGSLRAHYEYDPFGNTIFEEGSIATVNPFRFSSKYWDGDTKLAYYGYRYYGPGIGRWESRDPLGDPSFIKLILSERDGKKYFIDSMAPSYLFVRNASANYVDKNGLLTPLVGGSIVVIGGGLIWAGFCQAHAAGILQTVNDTLTRVGNEIDPSYEPNSGEDNEGKPIDAIQRIAFYPSVRGQ
jgi:RHS repeat-associated protein